MENATKKVLIIDDDARNIFALKAVLSAKKFSCLSAISASQGLEMMASDQNIAVVLMDMMMPDMDGYQAIKKIKDNINFYNMPVIAVTAQAMVGDKQRCMNAGAVAYISKPVNIDELLVELKNYL